MGSGVETVRETVDYLNGRGAKLGVVQVHLFRPFSVESICWTRCPPHRQGDCGARSNQGTGCARRASLPGRGDRIRRGDRPTTGARACRGSSAGAMGSRRRSSRRRWSRRCSTISRHASPKNHFTIGINDDVSNTSLDVRPGFITEADGRGRLHLLRPGRRRHGRGQQELDQDHRRAERGLRAGLLRLRLEEVRVAHRCRTSVSGRTQSDRRTSSSGPSSSPAINSSSSSASTCSTRRPTAPCSCSTARSLRPTSGTSCRDTMQEDLIRQTHPALCDRRRSRGASKRACPAASTPSCRPVSSRFPACCPATKRSRDQGRHPGDLRRKREGTGREQFRGRRSHAREPA